MFFMINPEKADKITMKSAVASKYVPKFVIALNFLATKPSVISVIHIITNNKIADILNSFIIE